MFSPVRLRRGLFFITRLIGFGIRRCATCPPRYILFCMLTLKYPRASSFSALNRTNRTYHKLQIKFIDNIKNINYNYFNKKLNTVGGAVSSYICVALPCRLCVLFWSCTSMYTPCNKSAGSLYCLHLFNEIRFRDMSKTRRTSISEGVYT